jgi:hypothetical protein
MNALQTTSRRPDRTGPGPQWWEDVRPSGEYASIAYDIRTEPLLAEISFNGTVVGQVTRNRYPAEVLNTSHMLIIDIDQRDDDRRCANPNLYARMALEGSNFDLIESVRARLDALPDALRQHAGFFAQYWNIHEDAFDSRDFPGPDTTPFVLEQFGWRLYETRNGCRLLEVTQDWGDTRVDSRLGRSVMNFIMTWVWADPAYQLLCNVQGLYRARLTPKPWRVGWTGAAHAAAFVGTRGVTTPLPLLTPLLEHHDRVTCALDGEAWLA